MARFKQAVKFVGDVLLTPSLWPSDSSPINWVTVSFVRNVFVFPALVLGIFLPRHLELESEISCVIQNIVFSIFDI